jgi:putative SOS response-associated peptidase YedK
VMMYGAVSPEFFEKAAGPMCNLYSLTKGQAAIRDIARAMRDTTGNLPPLPGIFPDQVAPVVRTARDGCGS